MKRYQFTITYREPIMIEADTESEAREQIDDHIVANGMERNFLDAELIETWPQSDATDMAEQNFNEMSDEH